MKLQLHGFETEFTSQHAVAVSVAAFVTWKLFSMMVNRRSLAHVPGPKRSSWWKGQSHSHFHPKMIAVLTSIRVGNFDQFLNRDGWAWHADLYKNYGGAARIEMPFGVSNVLLTMSNSR